MRFSTTLATSLTLLFALPVAAAPARTVKTTQPAEEATPDSGPTFDLKNLKVSAWVGGEFGTLSGFYLRADATVPVMQLAPKLKLLAVGSVGYVHLGESGAGFSTSWNMAKVLVGGRVQMDVAPKLDVFGDAGLGFYFGGWKTETPAFLGLGPISASGTSGGFAMRLAVGGHYEIDPRFSVGAELGLNPYFGDGKTTNFFIGVGGEMKI